MASTSDEIIVCVAGSNVLYTQYTHVLKGKNLRLLYYYTVCVRTVWRGGGGFVLCCGAFRRAEGGSLTVNFHAPKTCVVIKVAGQKRRPTHTSPFQRIRKQYEQCGPVELSKAIFS